MQTSSLADFFRDFYLPMFFMLSFVGLGLWHRGIYHIFRIWSDISRISHRVKKTLFLSLDKNAIIRLIDIKSSIFDLCAINYSFYYIFLMASICYNICLCIDLIITLKYPLYPGKNQFLLLIFFFSREKTQLFLSHFHIAKCFGLYCFDIAYNHRFIMEKKPFNILYRSM